MWPDAAGVTALVVALALAVPFILVWLARSPTVAIVALISASAAPRLFIEIMGLKARPEHIIAAALIVVAPFLWKSRTQPVSWIWADRLAIVYVGLIFFSSIFMSVEPRQTLKWALQQVLAILPYFWLRVLITNRASFRWAFRVLLVVGAVVSAYAVLCLYSYLLFGSSFGLGLDQYEGMPATYGLQYEPNILGAYGGTLAVMMLVMYLWSHRRKYLLGYAFCGLASMAVSLSRAGLIATALILAVVGLIAFRKNLLNKRVVLRIAAATLGAFLLVAPVVLQHFTERFSTVEIADPTADPNTFTRAIQTVTAIDEVTKHPIFGGGIASFQLAFDWQDFGTGWEDQGWIGNTELRVLHDTGIAGLLTFAIFLSSLVWLSRKALKRESSPELIALLAGGAVYCITFQATEGTLLAFSWVQLGLIGCAVAVMSRQEKNGTEVNELAST